MSGNASTDDESRRGGYADVACSEEDSSVMDSDDLLLRQRRRDGIDDREDYGGEEELAEDEDEDDGDDEISRDPSSSLARASMFKLQSTLQIQDSSVGRCMHEGDDEGRPPASKRARKCGMSSSSSSSSNASDDDDNDGSGGLNSFSRHRRQNAAPLPPPTPAAAAPSQSWKRLKRCWLCTFANCKMAKQVSEFVSANAGVMDPSIMADQIKAEVMKVCTFEFGHASKLALVELCLALILHLFYLLGA